MSLNIQNVQTKSNYNLSFTAASGNISKVAANVVPAVAVTGAAVAAALVPANNSKPVLFIIRTYRSKVIPINPQKNSHEEFLYNFFN